MDADHIPDNILKDTGLAAHLLVFLRTLSDQKPSREDMEKLLGIIKGTRRPWPAPANSKRQTIPKGVSGRKASECERRIRRAARPLGNLDSGHRRSDSQLTGQAHFAALSLPMSRQFSLSRSIVNREARLDAEGPKVNGKRAD